MSLFYIFIGIIVSVFIGICIIELIEYLRKEK